MLKASYLISYKIAKYGKSFSTGEFVKECMVDICGLLFQKQKEVVNELTLSRRTIGRRIEDIGNDLEIQLKKICENFECYSIVFDESTDIKDTSQLMIFIRGMTSDFVFYEEFLSLEALNNTTKGSDICSAVMDVLNRFNLPLNRLVSITTDGAPALVGKMRGAVKLISDKVEKCGGSIISFHCIIHQLNLCKNALNIDHVISPVVKLINTLKSKALNHRQFKLFLENCECNFSDVVYFSKIRWLSIGNSLERVWALKDPIRNFLQNNEISSPFLELMKDEKWKCHFAFTIDIFVKLNELLIKLQGKNLWISHLYNEILIFERNLLLFMHDIQVLNFYYFEL